MLTIRTRMNERVQELHSVAVFNSVPTLLLEFLFTLLQSRNVFDPIFTVGVAGNHVKDLNLIISCFLIVTRAFLDFKCHIRVVVCVARQPNS